MGSFYDVLVDNSRNVVGRERSCTRRALSYVDFELCRICYLGNNGFLYFSNFLDNLQYVELRKEYMYVKFYPMILFFEIEMQGVNYFEALDNTYFEDYRLFENVAR